jgi:hypothetical protein
MYNAPESLCRYLKVANEAGLMAVHVDMAGHAGSMTFSPGS